jgi:hypothetical protein
MPWRQFLGDRSRCLANILRVRTTGVKAAAAWVLGRIRHLTGENDALHLGLGIGLWNGRKQRLGVWMKGALEEVIGVRQLDDLTGVHNGNPISDMFDHSQIVSDEDVGKAETLLKIL